MNIDGKIRQKLELQAGAYHPTSREPHFPTAHLAPGPAPLFTAARLLSGTASLFPKHGCIRPWEDLDLGGCDSYKWPVQAL